MSPPFHLGETEASEGRRLPLGHRASQPLWGMVLGWCHHNTWVQLFWGTHLCAWPFRNPNWVGSWVRAVGEGSLKGPSECPAGPANSPSPKSSPGICTGQRPRPHSPVRSQAGNQSHWAQSAGRMQAGAECRARWQGVGRTGGDKGRQVSGVVSPRGSQGRYPLSGPRWTLASSTTFASFLPKGLRFPFVTTMAPDLKNP